MTMNGLTTLLLSTSSMTVLSFVILWIKNSRKKRSGMKDQDEKRLQEKILHSSKLSWKKVGTVKDIIYYPLKSAKGKSIKQCEFGPYGISKKEPGFFLTRDRMFLVYDEETGKYRTGATHAKLTLVNISAVDENRAQLEAANVPTLIFNLPRLSDENAKLIKCFVWMGDAVECLDCGSEVSEWLSIFLTEGKSKLRLGMGVSTAHRKVTGGIFKKVAEVYPTMRDEDTGLFSYMASYMLLSEASVDDLNRRLKKSVPPVQLRPNVIVKDCEPYAEDQWEWIKIGNQAIIRNFKPCTRCIISTIDPDTGIPDSQCEPLKTLRTYRKIHNKEMNILENYAPALGIYCGLYRTGEVCVGDDIFVYQPDRLIC